MSKCPQPPTTKLTHHTTHHAYTSIEVKLASPNAFTQHAALCLQTMDSTLMGVAGAMAEWCSRLAANPASRDRFPSHVMPSMKWTQGGSNPGASCCMASTYMALTTEPCSHHTHVSFDISPITLQYAHCNQHKTTILWTTIFGSPRNAAF